MFGFFYTRIELKGSIGLDLLNWCCFSTMKQKKQDAFASMVEKTNVEHQLFRKRFP